ncbi:MAG TPA: sialidase family protein [Mycobacteriales bacterium]|nr:sialidase family protein [Mycobacteriales bacterium]
MKDVVVHRFRTRAVLVGAALSATFAATTHAPAQPSSAPTFRTYAHPSDTKGAWEPTIGVNRETGAVMYQSGLNTYRVTGFESGSPEWTTANSVLTSIESFDPILTTDFETGRTFVSQLTLACSLMAYTDTDGRTWQEVPDGCGVGSFFDHQSVGTGAFVRGGRLQPATSYPRAVYYCSQATAATNCATSVDGGLTFLPAVNAWHIASGCSTIHGHIASAPDGTVYVPPRRCGQGVGVAVSENNGLSWAIRTVPDSIAGAAKDPSIAAGADGTAYLAWGQGGDELDTVPHVAVTRDRGRTWTEPVALGREYGIRNTAFIATVAGDGNRAAVAFLGTPTGGPNQTPAFAGVWRLYVSFTYDRGATWRTVLATPGSPVQVGKICTGGIACNDGTRNLLDFMGATIDPHGRVLVGFADGCLESMCDSSARFAAATIARQHSGRTLYRLND